MGQKINPVGLRIAVTKAWKSRWFSDKKTCGLLLHEDSLIRERVKKRLEAAAVAEIIIERYANRVRTTICTARPLFPGAPAPAATAVTLISTLSTRPSPARFVAKLINSKRALGRSTTVCTTGTPGASSSCRTTWSFSMPNSENSTMVG